LWRFNLLLFCYYNWTDREFRAYSVRSSIRTSFVDHTKGHRNLNIWIAFYVRVCALYKCIQRSRYMSTLQPKRAFARATVQLFQDQVKVLSYPKALTFRRFQAVTLCLFCRNSGYMKLGKEHWWHDTDRVKQKYSVKNLTQCHFVRHKLYTDRPGTELGRLRWETGG
jgi:hypothetical protein